MKFNTSIAEKTMKGNLTGTLGPHEGKVSSKLYRQFYDTGSGDPIDFDVITGRIQRRFSEMNKLSVHAMLDLYFVHKNWKSFYNRKDSFQNFCKNTLQISKAHAYGILHAVDLLEEYYGEQGKEIDAKHFVTEIADSIEQIGIRKLREIAGIREKPLKRELLTKLLDGENISTDKIVQTKQQLRKPSSPVVITESDNVIYLDENPILTLSMSDNKLKSKMITFLTRYFQK